MELKADFNGFDLPSHSVVRHKCPPPSISQMPPYAFAAQNDPHSQTYTQMRYGAVDAAHVLRRVYPLQATELLHEYKESPTLENEDALHLSALSLPNTAKPFDFNFGLVGIVKVLGAVP